MTPLTIQSEEEFGRLMLAPVTEAVLEIRGRAETEWEEERVTAFLKEQLPGFPKQDSQRSLRAEMRFGPGVLPKPSAQDLGWSGVTTRSQDQRQVVCFQKDGFAFSQLAPYPGWQSFLEGALALWKVHQAVAAPSEFARIGLRYINRIDLSGPMINLEDYLVAAPKEPEGLVLPFSGFLHRDTLTVPGHDYGVQITRTIQPSGESDPPKLGLIIDIDVFSTKPWVGSTDDLVQRLKEMRWLKNKAFFGSLTPQAKALLQ
jgi:uncharacterized protein (TIGR04255 family)